MAELANVTDNTTSPPEFVDDDDNGVGMPGVGMSEDDFAGVNTDEARDERTRATMDPPQGDWLKTDKFDFSYEYRTNDSEPSDLKPMGRCIFKLSGHPDVRVVNGVEYAPKFFINMSPDYRDDSKQHGKADLTHTLWIRAKDLFLSVKQRKHQDIPELIKFLRFEEYVIRMARGSDNLYCVGLKSKQALRGREIK